jgi:hypothetical protein
MWTSDVNCQLFQWEINLKRWAVFFQKVGSAPFFNPPPGIACATPGPPTFLQMRNWDLQERNLRNAPLNFRHWEGRSKLPAAEKFSAWRPKFGRIGRVGGSGGMTMTPDGGWKGGSATLSKEVPDCPGGHLGLRP